MWYIFPQLRGLGASSLAQFCAISGLPEARAYLAHPILGPRLLQCTEALLALEGQSAREILGTPDDLKLRSCATLFAQAAGGESAFARLLRKYFRGEPDLKSLQILGASPN